MSAGIDWNVYVPGSWRCAKCSFVLTQATLRTSDGTVEVRDAPGEKCPNDGAPLWRLTWRQYAGELEQRLEAFMKESPQ